MSVGESESVCFLIISNVKVGFSGSLKASGSLPPWAMSYNAKHPNTRVMSCCCWGCFKDTISQLGDCPVEKDAGEFEMWFNTTLAEISSAQTLKRQSTHSLKRFSLWGILSHRTKPNQPQSRVSVYCSFHFLLWFSFISVLCRLKSLKFNSAAHKPVSL